MTKKMWSIKRGVTAKARPKIKNLNVAVRFFGNLAITNKKTETNIRQKIVINMEYIKLKELV